MTDDDRRDMIVFVQRKCIHPSLVCDGHPQCDFAEDEDFEMCHDRYLERKIIKPFASLKCQSLMYPSYSGNQ